MIIESDRFIKLISWFMKPAAITLYPFIVYSPKRVRENKIQFSQLLTHELIHIQQQKELLVIGFYILYFYYFIRGCIRYRNINESYRQIPFEREARLHDLEILYYKSRKRFAWASFVYNIY